METKFVTCMETDDKTCLKEAGEILKAGGLVAFPTETVYGLGGDALNPASAKKIYAAKGRPSDNPLIVHICRWEDIYKIVSDAPQHKDMLARAKKLADVFWPGPLTMILPKSEAVPVETTGGLTTVAVRFPSHKTARALIAEAGGYVAAPSANTSGKPSPTLAKYVAEDMDGRIDMIVDGGEVGIGLESTIVDLTVEPAEILRPGYITHEMLEEVLGNVETDITILSDKSGQAPKAPGMKYRHYAPKGELTIVSGFSDRVVAYVNEQVEEAKTAGKKTGVIATDETMAAYRADVVKSAGKRNDELTVARRLYTMLREFDDENVELIYSEAFADAGVGQAVMNRLLKAAGHHVTEV
ncbi:MAG: L-threonylcarbamoyladenylate synthase [Lachnospiraceae bacterium]